MTTTPRPSGRCFVGFGFGPIQSGLFLLEAFLTGSFDRLVAAEIDQRLVDAIRAAGNRYTVNIAHHDGIRPVTVTNVEMLNPTADADRERLLDAIRHADELSTALPSVDFYARGPASVASLLTHALKDAPSKPRLLYTAENNNHAAEILEANLLQFDSNKPLANLQLANTVIGKMSGVITDPDEIRRLRLAPLVPGFSRAILVEEFNRILISRVTLPGFTRAITVFEERDHLLALEEAKLYGHNAVHALIGYLAHQHRLPSMSDAPKVPAIMNSARQALLEESGPALIARHAATGDPLFTSHGFSAYAEDLLPRIINPYLSDKVDRIIRDPERKLGWSDRLFGTMRLALEHNIEPRHYASGAAAALLFFLGQRPASESVLRQQLLSLWHAPKAPQDFDPHVADRLSSITWEALAKLP
jgi:mannitol-1-phosphate 5-dehydrogenase